MANEEYEEHRSTARVLSILELLSREETSSMTLSELGRAVGAPRSSLLPILRTMAAHGFVAYDQETQKYSIGLSALLAGKSYERTNTEMKLMLDEMHEVVRKCGETCQLGILERGRVLYVAKVDSPEQIGLKSEVGKSLPLYCTAIGKSLMADMTRDEVRLLVEEPFAPYTGSTLTTLDELWEQVSATHVRRLSSDESELSPDVTCIAAPIRVHGAVRYGMGISTPSFRFTEEKRHAAERALTEARLRIESALA